MPSDNLLEKGKKLRELTGVGFKYCKIAIDENNGNIEKTKEPIDPEIVLLGLIFVNFLPPIILPNIYPPISEKMQTHKIVIKKIVTNLVNLKPQDHQII